MERPSKPSWRRDRTPAGRRPAGESEKHWKDRAVDPNARDVRCRYRARLILLGLTTVTLITLFILFLVWMPKRTPFVVIGVTDYANKTIPPNSYVLEDVRRLSTINSNLFVRDAQAGFVSSVNLSSYLLEQIKQPRFYYNRDLVIVYLSAHGVVDEEGKPCLLLSDAEPLNSDSWFPVESLFDTLHKGNPKATKLLVLDAGKIETHWGMGILYNGFWERVDELVQGYADICVLTSNDTGQKAWAAPELGGSVFGHFVATGLRGGASSDRKIDLQELTRYVHDRVARYAVDNRASRQDPQLLSSLADPSELFVTYRHKRGEISEEPPEDEVAAARAEAEGNWQKVYRRWKNYDEVLEQRALHRFDPLGLAELQAKMLRLEALMLSGAAYGSELEQNLTEVDSLIEDYRQPDHIERVHTFSLPLAEQFQGISTPLVDRQAVSRQWGVEGGWPKDKEGKRQSYEYSYLSAAYVGWHSLLERESVNAQMLGDALELIDGTPRQDARRRRVDDVVEVLFMRMLLRYLDRPDGTGDFDYQTKYALRGAVQARQAAEAVAAPGDERVHYWVQPLVDEADATRRLGEDRLFVGDEDSVQQARIAFDELSGPQGLYGGAQQRRDEIARFYEYRDRAWASLPFLAQWLLSYDRLGTTVEINADPVSLLADLDRLVRDLGRLALELDEAPATDELRPSDQLNDAFLAVNRSLEAIEQAYDRYCYELISASAPDSRTLRAAHEALQAPLLQADDRRRLFSDKYIQIMFEYKPPADAAGTRDAESEKAEEQREAYFTRLAEMAQHPALAILDRTRLELPEDVRIALEELERPSSDLLWLEMQGGRVRQHLSEIDTIADGLEKKGESRLRDTAAVERVKRQDLSKSDQLARAAATILAERPWKDKEHDPHYRLRAVDRHFLFLWHAQRALDDFWGPIASDGNPYFEDVTVDYLDAAKTVCDIPGIYRHGTVDLTDLLKERKDAAKRFRIEPQELTSVGHGDETPKPEMHSIKLYWRQDRLPPLGEASVFVERPLRSGGRELFPVLDTQQEEIRRQGQSTERPSPATVNHLIPMDGFDVTKPIRLSASLLFRGHLRRKDFDIRRPEAVAEALVEPLVRDDATVVVRGDASRQGHIMFIVDCSGSMSENRRMPTAQTALNNVLEELVNEENLRVGLRAYGRRARKKLVDRRWESDFLPGYEGLFKHLGNDADDVVVGMSRYDDVQMEQIKKKLGSFQPAGVTPLYLAVKNSVEKDFGLATKEESQHIIVITDGINEQFGDTQIDGITIVPTSDREVINAIEAHPRGDIQIDIILMDPDRLQAGVGANRALDELRGVAEASGGQFWGADNADTLADAVRKALKTVKYSVAEPEDRVVDEKKKNLGVEWGARGFRAGQPRDMDVQLWGPSRAPRADIALEGGEAIEMEYRRFDNQLRFIDFARKYGERIRAVSEEPVPDSNSGESYDLNVLRPKIERNEVGLDVAEFLVAIQNADLSKFTPRPKQVWAEIQPVTRSGQIRGRAFQFSDLDFEADTPVPVLRFRAVRWPDPDLYNRAQIRMWFKFDPPPNAAREKVDGSGAEAEFASVPGLKRTQFRAWGEPAGDTGKFRVIVEQDYDGLDFSDGMAGIYCLQTPEQILHQYFFFKDRMTIRHAFVFDGQMNSEYRILPRTDIIRGAVEMRTREVYVRD